MTILHDKRKKGMDLVNNSPEFGKETANSTLARRPGQKRRLQIEPGPQHLHERTA